MSVMCTCFKENKKLDHITTVIANITTEVTNHCKLNDTLVFLFEH